jgi:hypothetical protein
MVPGTFFSLLVCDVQPKTVFDVTVIHASRDIPSRLAEIQPTLAAEVELLRMKLDQAKKGEEVNLLWTTVPGTVSVRTARWGVENQIRATCCASGNYIVIAKTNAVTNEVTTHKANETQPLLKYHLSNGLTASPAASRCCTVSRSIRPTTPAIAMRANALVKIVAIAGENSASPPNATLAATNPPTNPPARIFSDACRSLANKSSNSLENGT